MHLFRTISLCFCWNCQFHSLYSFWFFPEILCLNKQLSATFEKFSFSRSIEISKRGSRDKLINWRQLLRKFNCSRIPDLINLMLEEIPKSPLVTQAKAKWLPVTRVNQDHVHSVIQHIRQPGNTFQGNLMKHAQILRTSILFKSLPTSHWKTFIFSKHQSIII